MDCSWVKAVAKRRPIQQPPFYDNKKGTFDMEKICVGLGIDEIHYAKLLDYISHLIGPSSLKSRALTRDIRRQLRKTLDPILHNLPPAWAAKCIDQLIFKAGSNTSGAKRYERGRALEPRQELQSQEPRLPPQLNSKSRVDPSHDIPIGIRQVLPQPGWPAAGYQIDSHGPRDPTQFPRRRLVPSIGYDLGLPRNSEGLIEDIIRPPSVSVKREFEPDDSIISRPTKGYIMSRDSIEVNRQSSRAMSDRYIPDFETDRYLIRNSFPPEGLRAPDDRIHEERARERRALEERARERRAPDPWTLDRRAPELKTSERWPPERRVHDRWAPENRVSDRWALEVRAPERRALERWAPEKRAPERWTPEKRALERRAIEGRAPYKNFLESETLEKKIPEGRLLEAKVLDDKPLEKKVPETNIFAKRALEEKTLDPQTSDALASNPEKQILQEQIVEQLILVDQIPDGKPIGEQVTEQQVLRDQALEQNNLEEQATQEKNTDSQFLEQIIARLQASDEIIIEKPIQEEKYHEQQDLQDLFIENRAPKEIVNDTCPGSLMTVENQNSIHEQLEESYVDCSIGQDKTFSEKLSNESNMTGEEFSLSPKNTSKVPINEMAFMARRDSGDWVLLGTGIDLIRNTDGPDWDIFLLRLKAGLDFSLETDRLFCSWLSYTNGEELVGIFDAFGWRAGIGNMYRRGLSEFREFTQKGTSSNSNQPQQQQQEQLQLQQQQSERKKSLEKEVDEVEDVVQMTMVEVEKERKEEGKGLARSISLSSLDFYNDQ